tara:strand:+ start:169 stop:1383 length:1215 start_codon:yes stop_codon:yes gene_type:complete
MAITDKEQGVWIIDEVYNKINEGDIWEYTGKDELWAWGGDHVGQLGLNSINTPVNTGRSSPVQVGTDTTWAALPKGVNGSAGDHGYCQMATKTDGTLWMWGNNQRGQLGQNSLTQRSSPVQIPGTTWPTDPNHVDKSASMSCIKTDGSLWSWGYNWQGQAGTNVGLNHLSSPTQLPGTTWSKLGSARTTRMAIKTDGSLWTWGGNQYGTQGVNDRTSRSSPIQIPGSTWNDVNGGLNCVISTKTDGTLWMWGDNQESDGQLGQNNTTTYSSPVQIGTDTTWNTGNLKIVTNKFASMAIKTDGSLWAWGYNAYGNLGQNEGTNWKSSPVQIGTDTTWNKLSTWEEAGFTAIKTDGSLWIWGRGSWRGALGQSNEVTYSSPKQIGSGTDWHQSSGDYGSNFAITKQ